MEVQFLTFYWSLLYFLSNHQDLCQCLKTLPLHITTKLGLFWWLQSHFLAFRKAWKLSTSLFLNSSILTCNLQCLSPIELEKKSFSIKRSSLTEKFLWNDTTHKWNTVNVVPSGGVRLQFGMPLRQGRKVQRGWRWFRFSSSRSLPAHTTIPFDTNFSSFLTEMWFVFISCVCQMLPSPFYCNIFHTQFTSFNHSHYCCTFQLTQYKDSYKFCRHLERLVLANIPPFLSWYSR